MSKQTTEEQSRIQKFGKLGTNNLSFTSKKKHRSKKAINKKSRRLFMKKIRKLKSSNALLKRFDSQYQYSDLKRSTFEDENQTPAETDIPIKQNLAQIPTVSIDILEYIPLPDK